MIEGLSLGVVGIGSGWAIVTLGVVMLFRGDLRSKREALAQDRRLDAMAETLRHRDEAIANFRDSIETSNLLIKAVLDVAQERRP